jgi:hypothetical protein
MGPEILLLLLAYKASKSKSKRPEPRKAKKSESQFGMHRHGSVLAHAVTMKIAEKRQAIHSFSADTQQLQECFGGVKKLVRLEFRHEAKSVKTSATC